MTREEIGIVPKIPNYEELHGHQYQSSYLRFDDVNDFLIVWQTQWALVITFSTTLETTVKNMMRLNFITIS